MGAGELLPPGSSAGPSTHQPPRGHIRISFYSDSVFLAQGKGEAEGEGVEQAAGACRLKFSNFLVSGSLRTLKKLLRIPKSFVWFMWIEAVDICHTRN